MAKTYIAGFASNSLGGRLRRPIPASIGFWFSRDKRQDEKKP